MEGDCQQHCYWAFRWGCQVDSTHALASTQAYDETREIPALSKTEWTLQTDYCACRLRQNLAVPADGRATSSTEGTAAAQDASAKAQQYLRLPIESAKKLRWYDRPDLNNLVQQNLREKNDILGVNAALRQVQPQMSITAEKDCQHEQHLNAIA